MTVFRWNNQEVYYCRRGRGSPLVFIHNAAADHRIWDAQIASFRQTHTVYALDLPGHGLSSNVTSRRDLQSHVATLHTMLQHLSICPVTLVGSGLGSAIALHYAYTQPTQVDRLMLVNTLTLQTLAAGRYGKVLSLACRSQRFRHFLEELPERFETKTPSNRPKSRQASPTTTDSALPSLIRTVLASVQDLHLLDQLVEPISLPPICSVWGTGNPVLPAQAGHQLCSNLGVWYEENFVRESQYPMRGSADRFNQLLYAFIDATSTFKLSNNTLTHKD